MNAATSHITTTEIPPTEAENSTIPRVAQQAAKPILSIEVSPPPSGKANQEAFRGTLSNLRWVT
ncbi:hypothetical protein BH23CHL5_BH23CHL5_27940 [soil metagenome]